MGYLGDIPIHVQPVLHINVSQFQTVETPSSQLQTALTTPAVKPADSKNLERGTKGESERLFVSPPTFQRWSHASETLRSGMMIHTSSASTHHPPLPLLRLPLGPFRTRPQGKGLYKGISPHFWLSGPMYLKWQYVLWDAMMDCTLLRRNRRRMMNSNYFLFIRRYILFQTFWESVTWGQMLDEII